MAAVAAALTELELEGLVEAGDGAYRASPFYDRGVSAIYPGRALRAVVLGLLVVAALAPVAHARRVAVVVVKPFASARYAHQGAIGLLVPGAGSTVTRAGALSSLVRGKVVSSLIGGKATGAATIGLAAHPAAVTIYVTLPPPGRSHNTRRYPVAIVGGGYHGVLVSGRTKIPGLISIADIAPTAVALEHGKRPRRSGGVWSRLPPRRSRVSTSGCATRTTRAPPRPSSSSRSR